MLSVMSGRWSSRLHEWASWELAQALPDILQGSADRERHAGNSSALKRGADSLQWTSSAKPPAHQGSNRAGVRARTIQQPQKAYLGTGLAVSVRSERPERRSSFWRQVGQANDFALSPRRNP